MELRLDLYVSNGSQSFLMQNGISFMDIVSYDQLCKIIHVHTMLLFGNRLARLMLRNNLEAVRRAERFKFYATFIKDKFCLRWLDLLTRNRVQIYRI